MEIKGWVVPLSWSGAGQGVGAGSGLLGSPVLAGERVGEGEGVPLS